MDIDPAMLHDEMAEVALAGSAAQSADTVAPMVCDFCPPEFFFNPVAGAIYACVLDLHERGVAVDIITVKDALTASPAKNRNAFASRLEELGGVAGERMPGVTKIVEMVESVPSHTHAMHYAKIVRAYHFKRLALQRVERCWHVWAETDGCSRAWFDRAELDWKGVSEAISGNVTQESTTFAAVGDALLTSENEPTIRTTFDPLDNDWGPLSPGDLVLVAGRPSHGKSTFAMNLTTSMAESGLRVAVYSLEMDPKDWWIHAASSMTGIDAKAIRRMKLSAADKAKLLRANAREVFTNRMLFQAKTFDVRTLCGDLRRMVRSEGVSVVVIDYLQLLTAGRSVSAYERVTEVSRRVTAAIKESGALGIVVAQMNRQSEQGPRYVGKEKSAGNWRYGSAQHQTPDGEEPKEKYRAPSYPRLGELRDSGALEQDADAVLIVHQPTREDDGSGTQINPRYVNMARLHCCKERKGNCGTRWMKFEARTLSFRIQADGFDPLANKEGEVDRSTYIVDREAVLYEPDFADSSPF